MNQNSDHPESPSDILPQCPCGHDRNHHMVSGQGTYTWSGWFWVLFGVTTKPTRVSFRCRRCNTHFDESTDQYVLERFSSHAR